MQFQIEGQTKLINAEMVQNKGAGDLLFEIDGKQFNLKILKSKLMILNLYLGILFIMLRFSRLLKQNIKFLLMVF